MRSVDRAMPTDDLERQLRSWMGERGRDTNLSDAYDTIVDTTRGAGQRPWFLVRRGIRRTTPISERRFIAERIAAGGVVVLLLGLVLATGVVVGGRLLADPADPLPSPSPLPTPAIMVSDTIAIEDRATLGPGTVFTSRLFEPRVTFQASARTAGAAEGDICPTVPTSTRSIVFSHPKGCVGDLRITRPWAVACGSAGDHPDADALATAILAIPATSGSTDLGDLQTSSAIPPGMFADEYQGRVVEMRGYAPLFAGDVTDRDHCLLRPDPGSRDPVIEIRRDMSALFVLIDLDGELIVIRASTAGHDRASGIEAQSRGYAAADPSELQHLLGLVHDIRFGD